MLEVIIHQLDSSRSLTGMCAGYELKSWRAKALADLLLEALPDFCLTFSEYKRIDHESAVKMIRQAARLVYQTKKFENRGEFGELLLHVALKATMKTLPAVSKIYYKDASNDTVKGFDAVHVIADDDGLELWLGEVKFYSDIGAAIRDVCAELEEHMNSGYLRNEFMAIVNKIDRAWPHAEKLMKLLDEKTSLDDVFKAVCVPVLLTYDGSETSKHTEMSDAYRTALAVELKEIHARFVKKASSIDCKIHLFLIPMCTKEILISELDEKLKAWQGI